MKPILEEFRELVGIDCASGKERMLADVLKRKLEALGFTVREDEAAHVWRRYGNPHCHPSWNEEGIRPVLQPYGPGQERPWHQG